MENRDRTRDQGGRQPGTGTDDEGNDRSGTDPRRTREQEQDDDTGVRSPDRNRPDQSPRTA